MKTKDWADKAATRLEEIAFFTFGARQKAIARTLRRHFKRGYDQGVIAMATKTNQASGKSV